MHALLPIALFGGLAIVVATVAATHLILALDAVAGVLTLALH